MTEVMNRADRRAAKAGRPRPKSTPPLEAGVYIIPMELTEHYYQSQIAREGIWRDDPPVIVHRPAEQMFRADDAWFYHTLSQMREVRRPGTNRCVFPPEGDRDHEIDIDIGLIDVQIYFNASVKRLDGSLDMGEVYRQYNVNLREFGRLCGRQLTTQMVLAAAVHLYRPDRSHSLYYHNLIFGIRKQVEPDEHIGLLELLPLVKALGDNRTLKIIEEL